MPRRRPTRTARRPAAPTTSTAPTDRPTPTARPAPVTGRAYGVEPLETRTMLTTLTSTPASGPGQFNYVVGSVPYQINFNNVTFEAVAGLVDTTTGQTGVGDLLQQPVTTPDTIVGFLYKIYVTSATAGSFISVSEIDPTTGNLIPFAGGIGPFQATSPQQRPVVPTFEANTGSVLIGALSAATPITPLAELPLTRSIGVLPAPAGGNLTPGIQVLAVDPATGLQNDIGNIAIGGTVTGTVSIGGNIGQFYAGQVLTGNIAGGGFETGTSATPALANFTVGGDLGEFVSLGPVGTDAATVAGPIDNADYLTDFVLSVGGSVGEIHVGNAETGNASRLFGAVLVANDPAVARQTVGVISPTNPFQVLGSLTSAVEVETVSQTPGTEIAGGVIDLRNDTQYFANTPDTTTGASVLGGVPADAQLLGTQPVLDPVTGLPTRDEDGNIVYQSEVTGTLQGTLGDLSDVYGEGLRAGQTITVTANGGQNGPTPALAIFDPDGREVATNAQSGPNALQFTPTRPGIYTFDVTQTSQADNPYELLITGVADMGLGGLSVAGDYSDIGFDGGIRVGRGDLGAIAVGDTFGSLTSGPTAPSQNDIPVDAPSTIVVAAGSLSALVAGEIGERTTGNPNVLAEGPYLNVPAGDVGLIRATGFNDSPPVRLHEGVLDVHSRFDPNYLGLATPQFVTDDTHGWAIGGSIQAIDADTTFEGELATNRGIGTVRAGDMATDTASFFDVNADNAGQDGIIDLIDCTGSFGDITGGGPGFVTHDGGDIRYMNLLGAIFVDNQFGGGAAPTITYPISQVVRFTDDGGNSVSLTPVGEVQTSSGVITPGSPITSVPTPTNTSATLTAGPQVRLVTYPVRDKAGLVPVSVSSSGGLVITGNGTSGAGSQVEIGHVTINGVGRDVVRTGLTDAFGNATIFQPDPADANADTANGVTQGPNTDTGLTTNTPAEITTTALNGSTGTTTGTGGTSTPGGNTGNGTGAGGPGGTGLNGNGATGATSTSNPTGGALSSSGTVLPGASDIDVSATAGGSRFATAESNATDLILVFQGTATVSAFSVTSTNSAVTIADTTPGEIVSLTAPGVGTLQVAGNLGFATGRAVPSAAVYPRAVIANGDDYPFLRQSTGVVIGTGFLDPTGTAAATTGYAVNVAVGGAIANYQSGLTTQNLVVNYDHTSTPGQVDGVVGPIAVGRLLTADVGEGVTPTGTGIFAQSGIYGTFKLGVIDNYGNPNGDIRGNIVSTEYDGITNRGVDSVQVRNASIINSRIESINPPTLGLLFGNTFGESGVLGTGRAVAANNNGEASFANPYAYDIGSVAVAGDGGIIGTQINFQNVGPVLVTGGGFGILTSQIVAGSGGRIASVVASGYGVRNTTVSGAFLGPITASGSGALVPTTTYPIDVRPSDTGNGLTGFDPFFGITPNNTFDLNAALGTSRQFPTIPNVTDTGIIQDDTIQASSDFAGLTAHIARTALPLFQQSNVLPQPQVSNIPVVGVTFANSVTVGGTIGYVRVFSAIDGLQVTAGRIKLLKLSNNLNRIGLSVAGPIDNLTVNGNVGQLAEDFITGQTVPDSYIDATGPSGRIGKLLVRGSLFANLRADAAIGTATILGDVQGSILVEGQTTGLALGTLRVSGAITNGALNVTGRVGSILVDGSLGAATDSLTIAGSVNLISVGSNHRAKGSALALALSVNGSLNTLRVNGSITGSVHVQGDLHTLAVTGDGTTPAAVAGTVTVGERLFNADIANGSVTGAIDANLDLFNFNLTGGSLDASGVVRSDLAGIHSVRIAGGAADGLYGTVASTNGGDLRLAVSGNVGDGVNPASVSARSGSTFTIGGSIQNHATVSVAGRLQFLVVGGDIAAGAVVSANPLVGRRVRGTDALA